MARRRSRSPAVAAAALLASALAAAAAAAAFGLAPLPGRLPARDPPSLCGRAGGPAWKCPPRSGVEAASLSSIWAATGIGPTATGVWARLAVYAPFSWVNWLGVQFANAPAFYKYYIYYIIVTKLAKKCFPGLYAQVVTGTQLGLTKTVSYDKYSEAVELRLRELLVAQAKLRGQPGKPAPVLPNAVLEAATQRLQQDKTLTEALGSTAALAVWHKLERTPLSDPTLLQDAPPNSQARWILESLRAGYTDDLEEAIRSGAGLEAAKDAKVALDALSEAVSAAQRSSLHGLVEAGGDESMSQVEQASAEAAKAIGALQEAMAQDPAAASQGPTRRKTFEAKAAALRSTYAAVPAVAAELQRLAPSAGGARPAMGSGGAAPPPGPTAPTMAA